MQHNTNLESLIVIEVLVRVCFERHANLNWVKGNESKASFQVKLYGRDTF